MNLETSQFEQLVSEAWADIPAEFKEQTENVAIVIEIRPYPKQLKRVRAKSLLLGLFEGVPKPAWGQAMSGIQPSKITLFQETILQVSEDLPELKKNIKVVLMHELAHYFGYSEDDMCVMDEKLEKRLDNI